MSLLKQSDFLVIANLTIGTGKIDDLTHENQELTEILDTVNKQKFRPITPLKIALFEEKYFYLHS